MRDDMLGIKDLDETIVSDEKLIERNNFYINV